MASERWRTTKLGDVMRLDINAVEVEEDTSYRIAGVYSFARGLFDRYPLLGAETSYTRFHRLNEGHLVLSRLKAWEGALALVDHDFAGAHLSPEFPTFSCDVGNLLPEYAWLIAQRPEFWETLRGLSSGMGGRKTRVKADAFLSVEVTLPPVDVQRRVVDFIETFDSCIDASMREASAADRVLSSVRNDLLQEAARARIGDLILRLDGGQSVAGPDDPPTEGERGILKLSAIQPGRFVPGEVKRVPDGIDLPARHLVRRGDVLMTRSNTPEWGSPVACPRSPEVRRSCRISFSASFRIPRGCSPPSLRRPCVPRASATRSLLPPPARRLRCGRSTRQRFAHTPSRHRRLRSSIARYELSNR